MTSLSWAMAASRTTTPPRLNRHITANRTQNPSFLHRTAKVSESLAELKTEAQNLERWPRAHRPPPISSTTIETFLSGTPLYLYRAIQRLKKVIVAVFHILSNFKRPGRHPCCQIAGLPHDPPVILFLLRSTRTGQIRTRSLHG